MSPSSQIHAKISGPIVMIGFGSIGKGTLPLIERHLDYDKSRFVIIDPHEDGEGIARSTACASSKQGVTRGQLSRIAGRRCSPPGGGQGFASISRSTPPRSTSWTLCRELGALLYRHRHRALGSASISTRTSAPKQRSNYALREDAARHEGAEPAAATTAVSTCGANPGMVSWFVKQALLDIARDTKAQCQRAEEPRRLGRARAASSASRASTSPSATPSAQEAEEPMNVFVNTWSVEGFVSEGVQPAELGWGTTKNGCRTTARAPTKLAAAPPSICCSPAPTPACAPGARRRGAQYGFLVTHNEVDLDLPTTSRCATAPGVAIYRPTCHYAYHPANDAGAVAA